MTDITEVQDEGTVIELLQGGSYTVARVVSYAGEISSLTFLRLSDTPETYEGQGGKTVTVKEDLSGLEFSKTYSKFTDLEDTPVKYEGHAGALIGVTQDANGLRFLNYTLGEIHIEYFTQLADVPNSYVGKENYLVTVNSDANGLEFNSLEDILPNQSLSPGGYAYPKITVDIKGRITAIEEGSPFEFDPFEEGKLLIGDGTQIPASFPNGNDYSVLYISPYTHKPNWGYPDYLRTSNGNLGLKVEDQGVSSSTPLVIYSASGSVSVQPASTQDFNLVSTGNFTISQNSVVKTLNITAAGNFNIIGQKTGSITSNDKLTIQSLNSVIELNASSFNFNNNMNFSVAPVFTATGTFTFNPSEGKLKITDSVLPNTYAARITHGNDLTTKQYVDNAIASAISPIGAVKTLKKSNTELFSIDGSGISFNVGQAYVRSIVLASSSPVNPECTVRVTDNLGNVLLDGSDLPYFGTEPVEAFINFDAEDLSTNYSIIVTPQNYQYGDLSVFVSFY